MNKKHLQLGMNPSTASGRLLKDLLFYYIPDKRCYHCGKEITRQDFSIEHKIPWLDSENPVELFFNLDNISFSHLSCNISKARKSLKSPIPKEIRHRQYCKTWWDSLGKEEQKRRRKEKYLKHKN